MNLQLKNVTQEELVKINKEFDDFSVNFDIKKVKRLKECLLILDDLKLNYDGIEPALLLFKLKEGAVKVEDIKKEFGEETSWLVETTLKIENFRYKSEENEAEKIRCMFVAMAKDLRVVFITLANVLSRLRNLEDYAPERQNLICTYAEEIYAPLAEKLGLSNMKGEMEDICFRFLKPNDAKDLDDMIDKFWPAIDSILNELKTELKTMLSENSINGEIFSRRKHTSSVYKKLINKNVNLQQVYDLAAVRILVNSIEDCYLVLGKIHAQYKPVPDRVKDYIATPKPNGYQSLHTTIIYKNDKPIEVQIRTFEMHRNCEYGIASHWLYKEKRSKQNSLDMKFSWLREILDLKADLNPSEFLDILKTDLSNESVYVQTPRGKVLEFVKGASVIDFAYAIHSNIGDKCVGAIINGKNVKLKTELQNGDVIEIITNQLSKGPSREWLKFVKTIGAKSKINHFFKTELKDENIKKGKLILEHAAVNKGYKFSELINDKYVKEVCKKFAFNALEDIFAAVGYGSMPSTKIIQKLIDGYVADHKAAETAEEIVSGKLSKIKVKDDGALIINGDNNTAFNFARCCNPIVGDDIVGYISRGRGVIVHRRDCKNLNHLETDRLIDALWKTDYQNSIAGLDIYAYANAQALIKTVNLINSLKLACLSISSDILSADQEKITIKVKVKDTTELNKLINLLEKEPYVYSVKR